MRASFFRRSVSSLQVASSGDVPLTSCLRRSWSSQATSNARSGTKASSRIGATWESFFQPAHRVRVSVPATTSNLGPGFDCFGLSLDLRNNIVVERADEFSISIFGEGEGGGSSIPESEANLVVRKCYEALDALGKLEQMPPLRFECHNVVPSRRGLGSSSSATLAGLAAGLALGGRELYTPPVKKQLLQLAADSEGSADNVAAGIYGGFQVSFQSTDGSHQWITQRVAVPRGLHCVLYIPDDTTTVEREAARSMLPAYYKQADAVHNIGRAAMLVNCFATGQFDALRFAMEDRLHQQYRAGLYAAEGGACAAGRAGRAGRCTPSNTCETMHAKHCTPGTARQALHAKRCTLMDARRATHAERCMPSDARALRARCDTLSSLPLITLVTRVGTPRARAGCAPRRFPFEPLLHAALKAGAHGAFLSSQGPAVVAVCGGATGGDGDLGGDTMSQFLAEAVSAALLEAAARFGIDGEVYVATPSETGITSAGFAADGTPLWGAEWDAMHGKDAKQ